MTTTSRVGEMLVRARVIDAGQLEQALAHQKQFGGRLGQAVVELRFASEAQVVAVLSQALRMPKVALERVARDAGALEKVQVALAQLYGLFPCSLEDAGRTLKVAMADPTDVTAIQAVEASTRALVKVVVASETEIRQAIDRHYLGREPADTPAVFETLGPASPGLPSLDAAPDEVDEGLRRLNCLEIGLPLAKPSAPPTTTSELLEELLGSRPADSFTPAEAERVRALRIQLDTNARVLQVVLDLCTRKGAFGLEEYRRRLGQ